MKVDSQPQATPESAPATMKETPAPAPEPSQQLSLEAIREREYQIIKIIASRTGLSFDASIIKWAFDSITRMMKG